MNANLIEYEKLIQEIQDEHKYGQAFVKAVLIAIMTNNDPTDRNDYITVMGKTFHIDPTKVERVIELLPA